MNRILKIALSLLAIVILLFVFGTPTGAYSDVFLYIFILPIILILIRNILQGETENRFIQSQAIIGFVTGTVILLGQLLYFDGFKDMAVFGYAVFFVFFISLIGTQIDKKHEKIRNFFRGILFASFVFVIMFGIKLLM